MKHVAFGPEEWTKRLGSWASQFDWSRETRFRLVRWTVANALAGATTAVIFWVAQRRDPSGEDLLVPTIVAFGIILGVSQWLALKGWSSVAWWWPVLAPIAGLTAWIGGFSAGFIIFIVWPILSLPLGGGVATTMAGAAQWWLMRLNRPDRRWWLIASGVAGISSIWLWWPATIGHDPAEPIWTALWQGFAAGLTYGLISGAGFLRAERGPSVRLGIVGPAKLGA